MGALTGREKIVLRQKGFLPWEIEQFDKAKAGDTISGNIVRQDIAFQSAPFQAMIDSRVKYIQMLKGIGWQPQQIAEQISRYYNLKAGRTPWDFLKIEYKPARQISDFQWGRRVEVRTRISRTLGKVYGRRVSPQRRPKFIPTSKRVPPIAGK